MSRASRDAAPPCLRARSAHRPKSFGLPPGSWDTHAHVIGGPPNAPFVDDRSYTPDPASADDYVAMLDTVGITYGVVIQISVHGTDNRLIAAALRRYPHRLKGVISIDGSESEADLIALRDLGVCGIRVNEHFGGGVGADRLELLADRCGRLGWHVDLGLGGERIRELMPTLRRLRVPLVVDHMGVCPPSAGLDGPGFAAVLELAALDTTWVKLSGAYRVSDTHLPYDDVTPFVRALCAAAPERTIWASDWPNVAIFDAARMPETGEQLDALARQIADPCQLHAVLVDNPMRLYGRPSASSSVAR